MIRRSAVATLLALPVLVIGCGSDDDDDGPGDTTAPTEAVTTEPPATEPPATEPPATEPSVTEPPATEPPATEPPATEPPATEAPDGGDSGAEAAAVPVTLDEWFVEAPTELTAGELTFQIQNDGSFPHELVVIAGDGYESLPLADNGAVVESDLPDGAVVDRTDKIEGGLPGELTVDLPPGNYVLLCNIVVGPTSHAGRGQHLDVTVG